MHANVPLTEIALVIVCALICGLIFTRFKQPAILGYMLAGLVIGPYMVVDSGMAPGEVCEGKPDVPSDSRYLEDS